MKQTDQPISTNPLADGAGHTFFEAELLGLNEVPHRPIVDLEAAIGEFENQPAQSKGPLPHPLRQENLMLAADRLRLVPAHLARFYAAGLLITFDPRRDRAHRDLAQQPESQ